MAKENRRTTISAQDVITALKELEFDDFLPTLESALVAYREGEKIRSVEAAAKRAASAFLKGDGTAEGLAEGEAEDAGEEDGEEAEAQGEDGEDGE